MDTAKPLISLPKETSRKAIGLLFFLAAYLTAEDVLLKFLPVSGTTIGLLRLLPEMALYGTFGLFATTRLLRNRGFPKSPLNAPLVVFIASWLVSWLAHPVDTLLSLVTIRTAIRYFFAYYIVLFANPGPTTVMSWCRLVVGIGVVQSLLGIIQNIFPWTIRTFLPAANELSYRGIEALSPMLTKGAEIGAAIGTFGWTTPMAFYLCICLAIVGSMRGLFGQLRPLIAAFLFIGVLTTFSRASILAAGVLIIFLFSSRRKLGALILLSVGAIAFFASVASLDVSDVNLGSRAVERSALEDLALLGNSTGTSNREWVLKVIGKALFFDGGFWGFGPDHWSATKNIAEIGAPYSNIYDHPAWEDVYWIAIGVFFGVPAIFAILWGLLRHFKVGLALSKARNPLPQDLGRLTLSVVGLMAFFLFIGHALEVRAFGLIFWTTLGLAFSVHRTLHKPPQPIT